MSLLWRVLFTFFLSRKSVEEGNTCSLDAPHLKINLHGCMCMCTCARLCTCSSVCLTTWMAQSRHSGLTGYRSLSADAPVTSSHKFTWIRYFIVMEALSVILVRWSCVSRTDEYMIIWETLERQMKELAVFFFTYSLDPEIGGLDPQYMKINAC